MARPCIVCEYPVEIAEAKAEDHARLNTEDDSTNSIRRLRKREVPTAGPRSYRRRGPETVPQQTPLVHVTGAVGTERRPTRRLCSPLQPCGPDVNGTFRT